ncbi:MAG TPA: alpha/beta fold hydrolase [Gaiellales bacterium]|jgi:pimeloyl-ACP methyl ester carboxylesterase|nr:alpha/beta fold hydrolase [Gaiellales bacterium]
MAQPDPWLEHYGERRRGPRRSRRLGLALALAAAVLVVAAALALLATRDGAWRPPSGLGGFDGCSYGGRVKARCGRVGGLNVVVIPATRQPARGALFYLEGGPGGAAAAAAVSVDQVFGKISEFRDVVLVDQRGTGGSQPTACPQEHVRATDGDAVASYLRRCFAQLGRAVGAFTTTRAAGDLEGVRRTLGYGRIDVYGGSYGATLAQVYLRRYPHSVRTATLDGASLPGARVYELAARNAERALRLTAARCGGGMACRAAFPDTRAELATVLARHPVRADDLATTVAVLLRTPEDAVRVPLLVHQAARGDLGPLRREFAAHVGAELDARSRLPLFWVTICGEPWARFDAAATKRASRGSFLARAAAARARVFRQACAAVPVHTGAAKERPWSSRVPVLLLAGDADPQDPPANLAGWRAVFPNGRVVAVGGLAHGVIAYGCLRLVVARFVATGSARRLDASCARNTPLPRFELS